jgi:hypothetical protein
LCRVWSLLTLPSLGWLRKEGEEEEEAGGEEEE